MASPMQGWLRRLIMFAPLPPKRNGIADYTYELLTGLSTVCDCTVVVEAGTREALAPDGVTVISAVEYVSDAARYADVLHIYQLGNNRDHLYILPFIAETPGLIVLHDPSLHNLLDSSTNGRNDVSGYADALESEHGVAGRILGEQFRRFQLREERMFFDMPGIRCLAGSARGVIVHSSFAELKVLASAPDAAVTVVPHQFIPPASYQLKSRADARRELGVKDDEVLLMSLGFMGKSKQIDAALRVLASVCHQMPPFRYVLAGEIRLDEIDLPSLIDDLALADSVTTLGFVEDRSFFELIQASDVVINLRHPIGGETSGTMIRALGMGACVVVADRGPFSELPDDAAVKIGWGKNFEAELASTLLALSRDRSLRQAIGQNARQFIAARHSLGATVAGYRSAIELAVQAPDKTWATTVQWEFLVPQRLLRITQDIRSVQPGRHVPLWLSAGVCPMRGSSRSNLLWCGRDSGSELLKHLGYAESDINRPRGGDHVHLDAIAERSVDLVILSVAADIQGFVLVRWLKALNRILVFGGMVVLYVMTPKGEEQSATPTMAILNGIKATGFRSDLYVSGAPVDIFDSPSEADPSDGLQDRCWRLTKVTETFADMNFVRSLAQV